jgi:AAA+ superfamily predicted ATPase
VLAVGRRWIGDGIDVPTILCVGGYGGVKKPQYSQAMSADPAVIGALEAAIVATPNNVALRAHVAQLLIDSGRPEDALAHCRVALGIDPVNEVALGLGALSAGLCGETQAEQGYSRLLAGLRGQSVPSQTINAPKPNDEGFGVPQSTRSVELNKQSSSEDSDEFGGRQSANDREEARSVFDADVERSSVTLADVAGMHAVKEQIELAFLGPMRNAELRAAFGTSMRGGLLLYGPPGCGKTFLAKALAGELGASFFSIGLSDVLDMWIGASEKNLADVFDTARRAAPCVLFLDEVDAIGQKRSQLRHSGAMRSVVVQLLAEMDGVNSSNDGLFILGATNHPWDVDVALKRPGRFDRTVLVLPPDEPARLAILQSGLRERPCASDLDLVAIASATDGYSGSDLSHICDTSAQTALAASMKAGVIRPIGNHDLKASLKMVRPSIAPWFDTAENYANFANAAGEYDDLLAYIRTRGKRRKL